MQSGWKTRNQRGDSKHVLGMGFKREWVSAAAMQWPRPAVRSRNNIFGVKRQSKDCNKAAWIQVDAADLRRYGCQCETLENYCREHIPLVPWAQQRSFRAHMGRSMAEKIRWENWLEKFGVISRRSGKMVKKNDELFIFSPQKMTCLLAPKALESTASQEFFWKNRRRVQLMGFSVFFLVRCPLKFALARILLYRK